MYNREWVVISKNIAIFTQLWYR